MRILQLLDEVGIKTSLLVKLWCDNQTSLHIASNHVFHERTKFTELIILIIKGCNRSSSHQNTLELGSNWKTFSLKLLMESGLTTFITSVWAMINIYAPT